MLVKPSQWCVTVCVWRRFTSSINGRISTSESGGAGRWNGFNGIPMKSRNRRRQDSFDICGCGAPVGERVNQTDGPHWTVPLLIICGDIAIKSFPLGSSERQTPPLSLYLSLSFSMSLSLRLLHRSKLHFLKPQVCRWRKTGEKKKTTTERKKEAR